MVNGIYHFVNRKNHVVNGIYHVVDCKMKMVVVKTKW